MAVLIVNLRDDCVEVFADPDPTTRLYRTKLVARRGDRIDLCAFPGVSVAVDDLPLDPDDD